MFFKDINVKFNHAETKKNIEIKDTHHSQLGQAHRDNMPVTSYAS